MANTSQTLTISTLVKAPMETVWRCYTQPEHMTQWNFANDDWCCPWAKAELTPGGRLVSRMEAKDGSMGFDFEAVYDEVAPGSHISYTLLDGRKVTTQFVADGEHIKVTTQFDSETENDPEMQRAGWQAILENFKKHTEQQA